MGTSVDDDSTKTRRFVSICGACGAVDFGSQATRDVRKCLLWFATFDLRHMIKSASVNI
jgi:hypothetical protein